MGSRKHNGLFRPDEIAWQDRARCANLPPGAMFPVTNVEQQDAAKLCASCPVAEPCLAYALTHRIGHGVWGGATERDRRRILKQRRAKAAAGG